MKFGHTQLRAADISVKKRHNCGKTRGVFRSGEELRLAVEKGLEKDVKLRR